MPEAIATTKRKFYKALDALTNPTPAAASHDAASSTNNERSSAAAAAFDDARERARKRLRHSTSTTSLNDITATVSVSSRSHPSPLKLQPKSSVEPKALPNYSPWSQETFLARLKTYSSVSTWHPKPDPISEVEWAKRGWVCVDVNTVACRGGCERRVVVSLDTSARPLQNTEENEPNNEAAEDEDEVAAALEEALAERYKDEIINGHSSSCMWYKAGCKDDIYRLPVVRSSVWQPELSQRFRSLLRMSSSIDKIRTRALETSKSPSEKLLKELPRDIVDPADTTHPCSAKALQIALHGWRGAPDSGNDLLYCDACFQRVGLWMYQPEYIASRRRPSTTDEEADDASVDLVEMHRDHCPWRNAEMQRATGSLAGLNAAEILHRVVATACRDHRRRSHEPLPIVGASEQDQEGDDLSTEAPTLTREEVAKQDKERESRMRKLKNLFNIKRKSISALPARSTT